MNTFAVILLVSQIPAQNGPHVLLGKFNVQLVSVLLMKVFAQIVRLVVNLTNRYDVTGQVFVYNLLMTA